MMIKRWFKLLLAALCVLLVYFGSTTTAWAFCGFFVAKADAKLYNSSSRVIIARTQNRSIFFMANDYQGDVKDFARIVPIPVIPKREQVRIGSQELVEKLDAFTAPRLVQYNDNIDALLGKEVESYLWVGGGLIFIGLLVLAYRQNKFFGLFIVLAVISLVLAIVLPSFLNQPNKAKQTLPTSALNVTVADKFTVGEYDVTILSSQESNALVNWLIQNGYKVPDSARSMLQDYINQGMKFFVVKVNLQAFTKQGYGFLRPIVLDYESPKFMLPIRLGTLNATSDQDLIIHILSPIGFAEVANYRTVLIPTDAQSTQKEPSGEELPPYIQEEFGKFYAAMFQREYQREGKNVAFLEYAGPLAIDDSGSAKCDPCPLPSEETLKIQKLLKAESLDRLPYITRLHVRYTQEKFPKDLFFREIDPNSLFVKVTEAGKYFSNAVDVVFQGRYVIRRPQNSASELAKWRYGRWKNQWAENLAKLTGWKIQEIREKMALNDDAIAFANAWNKLGQNLKNSEQYQEALVYYNKAVSVDPGNSQVWYNRGEVLYELRKYEEALTSINKALALDANNWAARRLQMNLREELGH